MWFREQHFMVGYVEMLYCFVIFWHGRNTPECSIWSRRRLQRLSWISFRGKGASTLIYKPQTNLRTVLMYLSVIYQYIFRPYLCLRLMKHSSGALQTGLWVGYVVVMEGGYAWGHVLGIHLCMWELGVGVSTYSTIKNKHLQDMLQSQPSIFP